VTTIKKRNEWQIWRDVIFALFIREIRTGFNDKVGLAWAVIQPVTFIIVLAYLRGRFDGGSVHNIPTFVFIAYGVIFLKFFTATINSCASSLRKNKALFAFRQVQPLSSLIAIGFFQLLIHFFVAIIIALVMYLIGIEIRLDDTLSLLAIFFQLWLVGMSIGLLFCLSESYVPEMSKVRSLMLMPLLFISGILFSLKDIPQEYWPYLDWNPLLHAIELVRDAAYSNYGAVGVSSTFLVQVALASTFFALACYHLLWKQAISR
jgi:capsular polysaccharide transport system permease protein